MKSYLATVIVLVAVFSTVRAQVNVALQLESYTFSENDAGAEVCILVQSGSVQSGQTFTAGYGSFGITATAFLDYNLPDGSVTLDSDNQFDPLCVSIQILDDNDQEPEECFTIFFFDMDNDPQFDVIEPDQAMVCITDDDSSVTPATIGFSDTSTTVNEGSSVTACAQVMGGQQLDRNIVFTVLTSDGSALAGQDYSFLSAELSFNPANDQQLLCMTIGTVDDSLVEGNENFFVDITTSAAQVSVNPSRLTVTIVDNDQLPPDPCDPSPCDPNASCTPSGGIATCTCNSGFVGNGFTCMQMGGGDDPHFSIVLPSSKLLCFTVQGEHGFAFNLISNEHLHMNALFVPDSQREEVTWMGSLGIIAHYATNTYQGNNKTSLRFEAKDEKVHIGDKVTLDARGIHSLVFRNSKMFITEVSEKKEVYPSVTVNMEDVGLHFTIRFVGEHLDIYWNDVAAQSPESSGLIGQFFRKGVDVDETRKILIMPNKEPVPVMRRPVWSFMERETPDDQLCWTAMNPGYQGKGLIDGTYLDYLVDDVMSTDFKSPLHNTVK